MNVIWKIAPRLSWGPAGATYVVTIGKELPRAYDAVKTGSLSRLLNCGVDKSDIRQPMPLSTLHTFC